ncbi:MAG: phosphoribosylanthranilate isomerase [Ghiorsea sp.]|nr:phosphoribosylanthranilate isomerase [Ghiorsea sp.]
MRTRIKVCGITSIEDASAAVAAGADALGFVFYEQSPRFVSIVKAKGIIRQLPPFVSIVGLFVNAEQNYMDEVIQKCGLDVIQLHGDESPAICMQQHKPVIKAIAVHGKEALEKIDSYKCTVLLDAKAPLGVHGGTGTSFDWSLLTGLQTKRSLIIAGGLNPDNIEKALTLQHWYAVDVSSGVELEKGVKDHAKMKHFCGYVHKYNDKVNEYDV